MPNSQNIRLSRFYDLGYLYLVLIFTLFLQVCELWAGPEQDFIKRGKDYYGLFQYDKAKENFEKAIKYDPTNAEAHFYLGLCLRKLNRSDLALRSFERALQLNPEDLDCQKAVASMYVQMAKDQMAVGNREKTAQYLKKACFAYPLNCHNWVSLFELYQKDRKWNEIANCASLLKKANREAITIGEDKELQMALVMVANAYKELQDHSRAREFLNLAGMIRQPNDELLRLKEELTTHSKDVANKLLEEGRTLYENKKYKSALDTLLKAQAADSSNSEINDLIEKVRHDATLADFLEAANEAEKKGDYETALDTLNKALAFDTENNAIKDRIASISDFIDKRERAAKIRKAEELARKQALAEKKARLDALLNAARDNEKKKSFDAALISYQQALAIDNENPEILAAIERVKKAAADQKERMARFVEQTNQAMALIGQGQFDQAYAIMKALADDPMIPQENILSSLIDVCIKLGKFDEAEEFNKRLATIKPDSDDVNYYQGAVAYYRGDFEAAREPLYKVYKRNPSFKLELNGMIWHLWFNKYKWGLILAAFFIMLQLIKWGVNLSRYLRIVYEESAIERALASGQYEKIIPILEKKLNDTGFIPNRKQLTIALAEAYLRQGRFQEAIQRASEVIQKDSRNAQAMRILGEAYFQLKETNPDAIEKILNLFKLDESRRDLLAFLANHFRSIQAEHKMAIEVLQKQISLSPEDHESVFYVADLFLKRQNFQDSNLRVFERAAKLDPERPEYIHGVIQCLMQANRSEEAAQMLEKALQKWPDNQLFVRNSEKFTAAAGPFGRRLEVKPNFIANTAEPEFMQQTLNSNNILPSENSDETQFCPSDQSPVEEENPFANLPSLNQSDPKQVAQGISASPSESFEFPPLPPLNQSNVNESFPNKNFIPCPNCGAANNPREYYCGTCGRPLR